MTYQLSFYNCIVASANSILYKQSLKANNKSLAKALDFSKQDVAALGRRVLELEKEKQVSVKQSNLRFKHTELQLSCFLLDASSRDFYPAATH